MALYDAYNPDVVFAEVLLIPEWTLPTLNVEQIRANGGITPAPEPILPTSFTIQLYNPDQQILVTHKPGSLATAPSWEFEIPQISFRAPSSSVLDRSQDDPSSSVWAPKLSLKWKREGKLSKELVCYLSGRSSNPEASKSKHKEPDITIAIMKGLKEITLYEPNMNRLDVEDLKGFEVVLLLGSVVIRDVYFGTMRDTFHLSPETKKTSGSNLMTSDTNTTLASPLPIRGTSGSSQDNRLPPTDPRTQWELDQETERLKRQAAEEKRQQRRREDVEQKQIKKMLEAEDKERRRQEAEVDKETERLRKLYGHEDASARPSYQLPANQHWSDPARGQSAYKAMQAPQPHLQQGPYMTGAASSSSLQLRPDDPRLRTKSSVFGFRRHSNSHEGSKLSKKNSSVW